MSDWAVAIVGGTIASAMGGLVLYVILPQQPDPKSRSDVPTATRRFVPPKYEGDRSRIGHVKQPFETNSLEKATQTDGKYTIPFSISTINFTDCLKTAGRGSLLEERDFRIKNVSTLIRIIVPIADEELISESYENCRLRFLSK